jgi:hypothetical protein
MTKRRIILLTSMVTALALIAAGCGGSDGDEGASTEPSQDAIRVGLVADKGQLSDRGGVGAARILPRCRAGWQSGWAA